MKNISKAIGVGIVATLIMDAFNRILASFGIISVSHYEGIGRIFSNWFRGDFIHAGFGALKQYPHEYATGIVVHYAIGIILAWFYLEACSRIFKEVNKGWLPIVYGICTSVFAWFVMFPAVGLGVFGLAAPGPMHLFRTSLLNHLSYGIGITAGLNLWAYLGGWRHDREAGVAASALKKTKLALTLSLSLSSAGFSIAFVLGSLNFVKFADGDARFSGIAAALLLLSAALCTFPAGAFRDRFGQKALLLLAGCLGISSGAAGTVALATQSIVWLCAYLILMGATHGIIIMGRYAVAELAPAESRAKHMSHVIMGSTVGAIGGPLLIGWGRQLEPGWGLGDGMASTLFAAAFYILAFALFAMLLQGAGGLRNPKPQVAANAMTYREFFGISRIRFAMSAMVASQLGMVMAMAVTPSHMHSHSHHLSSISMVLSLHFVGMYGLSFIPGMLADRFGREVVIVLGGVLLAVGAVTGFLGSELPAVALALFLLGLGWNFCFLSSSVVIADTVKGRNMGKIQGLNEAFVNVSSGLASLGSGMVLARTGFGGLLGISLALAFVPVLGYAVLHAGRPAGVRKPLSENVPAKVEAR